MCYVELYDFRLPGLYIYIFVSETTKHKSLIFGMKNNMIALYQVCSNYFKPKVSLYVYVRSKVVTPTFVDTIFL